MAVLQHGTGMPAIDKQHIYGLVPPDYGIVRQRDYGCNPVRYPSSGDIARKLIERRERGETVLRQVLPIAGVWVDGDLLAGGGEALLREGEQRRTSAAIRTDLDDSGRAQIGDDGEMHLRRTRRKPSLIGMWNLPKTGVR